MRGSYAVWPSPRLGGASRPRSRTVADGLGRSRTVSPPGDNPLHLREERKNNRGPAEPRFAGNTPMKAVVGGRWPVAGCSGRDRGETFAAGDRRDLKFQVFVLGVTAGSGDIRRSGAGGADLHQLGFAGTIFTEVLAEPTLSIVESQHGR